MLNRRSGGLPRPFDGDSVAVIGGGLMGHGIAAVFASGGYEVSCVEPVEAVRRSLVERVAGALSAMGASAAQAQLVRPLASLEELPPGTGFVTEAAPEDLALKQRLLADLGEHLPAAAIASNTSVFRVKDVAAEVETPGRVVGTHWWNPPYLIPLVEVVQGAATAPEVAEGTIALLRSLGKLAVHVRGDSPGFVGNRLQHAMWREAMAVIDEGLCDPETVDLVVKNSFGLRLSVLGPIENADYVGLDLTRAIHEYVFPALSRAERPIAVLEQHVAAGELGAPSGRGFFEWTPERRAATGARIGERIRLLLDQPGAGE